TKQGRFRYYRLASPLVAQALEAVMVLAAQSAPSARAEPRIDPALRRARTCYDHIAGELGVAITDALVSERYLVLDHDAGEITPEGVAFFNGLGVDFAPPPSGTRRVFCRPCLDWSERRPHLAGYAGAALATYCLDRGLLKRQRHGRALTITALGLAEFRKSFGIDLRE
ncbi:MAG: transcriptional regulator, partial [Betaproteobacteria bacterium]|nr:transcriptional regulator [Betaproteobacteria bacterium]